MCIASLVKISITLIGALECIHSPAQRVCGGLDTCSFIPKGVGIHTCVAMLTSC